MRTSSLMIYPSSGGDGGVPGASSGRGDSSSSSSSNTITCAGRGGGGDDAGGSARLDEVGLLPGSSSSASARPGAGEVADRDVRACGAAG